MSALIIVTSLRKGRKKSGGVFKRGSSQANKTKHQLHLTTPCFTCALFTGVCATEGIWPRAHACHKSLCRCEIVELSGLREYSVPVGGLCGGLPVRGQQPFAHQCARVVKRVSFLPQTCIDNELYVRSIRS